ncbi:MAG: UDP-N-acetylmuramoyl-L-alanyl-D-glutamate--2,6-diaminopimelate ligase [Melioribacter sp.]|uniref:UDP-N-acetylmuramoyl-L-alanyl-D-glutamate--2, 6-diaminopimelate ligase n=1 Tax=Rosettibacter primus TaxID=3111523 RepID=UPI00247C33B8|nr:UDP-N-acetylmuramoyl-L-alanyl-D-glutamate--2,6-diaminopimelate ligase [Melioribacter sp.]
MKLYELLNNVKVIQVVGNAELKEIEDITHNSQSVKENTMFFAIEGFKTDGHKFIPDAINRGAAAVVLSKVNAVPDQLFLHANCVKIVVEDTRKSLAEFSHIFYGKPSEKLNLIGITGTKGKTTTAFYIKNIFETAKYKTGLIGTIANYIGDKEIKTMLTTPQSNEVNSLLAQMLNEGCSHCVMEVSSHALHLHRVDYLNFKYGVFTNITSDHMDYHKTFEHYLNSKKILFDMLPSDAFAVVNADDENVDKLLKDSKAKKIFYGTSSDSDFRIKDIEFTLDGTNFTIINKKEEYKIDTKLVGHFNAFNATAAFCVAVMSNLDIDTIIEGIKTTPQVPGRFEVISRKNKKVIIDYSHTADSLKQALIAIHHIVKNKRPVYTVFGCGGDRDRTKRPIMGSIASEMSKKVFVTSDNPRTENPQKIIEEILSGIKQNNFIAIENREEAIRTAIFESEDNAVILIAGKGHENYQEINGVRKYFSDKEIATKYLKEWAK